VELGTALHDAHAQSQQLRDELAAAEVQLSPQGLLAGIVAALTASSFRSTASVTMLLQSCSVSAGKQGNPICLNEAQA
jgi:hypothetical protein